MVSKIKKKIKNFIIKNNNDFFKVCDFYDFLDSPKSYIRKLLNELVCENFLCKIKKNGCNFFWRNRK